MVDVINLIPDVHYEEPRKSSQYYWSDRKKTIPGIERYVFWGDPEKEYKKILKEYQSRFGEVTMTKVNGFYCELVNNENIDINCEYLLAIVNGMWEPWGKRDIRYIYKGKHKPNETNNKITRKRLPYCAVDCTFSLTQKGPECKNCPPVIQGIEEKKKHDLARQKVKNLIKSGKISKPRECENCHQIRELEAHHIHYDEPLKIKWLCEECHNKITLGYK